MSNVVFGVKLIKSDSQQCHHGSTNPLTEPRKTIVNLASSMEHNIQYSKPYFCGDCETFFLNFSS